MSAAETSVFPNIVTDFGYAPIAPAVWTEDSQSGLLFRDLSLDHASKHSFIGRHYRSGGAVVTTEVLVEPAMAFAFLFVLAGSVTLTPSGGQPELLELYGAATRHGVGGPVQIRLPQEAEIMLLTASPQGAALFGTGNGSWVFSHEAEDDYILGNGPRSFFRYRDLGVAAATGRRIHIQIVRSTIPSPVGGTGWHHHGMGQLFYVLRGDADIAVEHQQVMTIRQGDAMCISKGMRHNVPRFTKDYLPLEMCIPADYQTIPVEPA